jgi:AcrR family transcriptional regulator
MSPRRPTVLRDDPSGKTLRDHLVATAAGLLAERGPAGLTVREIARAAGVADGALYNHFADKEELLAHALHSHVVDVMAVTNELPEAGTATVAENLTSFVRLSLTVLGRVTPVFVGFLGQPAVVKRFQDDFDPHAAPESLPSLLAAYLQAERDLGRVVADADPWAAAELLDGFCHNQVLLLLFQPPGTPIEVADEQIERIVRTVLEGIAPSPTG